VAFDFTGMTAAFAVENISGGVFNPAVAGSDFDDGTIGLVEYLGLLAQFAASVEAAMCFKVVSPEDNVAKAATRQSRAVGEAGTGA
jgi:aquaporin Z